MNADGKDNVRDATQRAPTVLPKMKADTVQLRNEIVRVIERHGEESDLTTTKLLGALDMLKAEYLERHFKYLAKRDEGND